MKHIKIYESFIAPYDFDIIEFTKKFKDVYYKEMKKYPNYKYENTDSLFFKKLSTYKWHHNGYQNNTGDWSQYSLNALCEMIIKIIFQDKEVEYYDYNDDIDHGRVKNSQIKFMVISDRIDAKIDLYEERVPVFKNVNCLKPIKIYDKKTEIEEIIEILSSTNKYNL